MKSLKKLFPTSRAAGIKTRRTGFLFDDRYLLHNTGPGHPETSDRLRVIYQELKKTALIRRLHVIKASKPNIKWIEELHDPDYIQRFRQTCAYGDQTLDCPDNVMSPHTFEVATLVIGGILKTIKKMMKNKIDNAFCAVRPPGHHAENSEAMGFCYFNNVAIAARYLQKEWGISRVGIMDFDVHHGNGTQHLFENDSSIFYYSIHGHPSYTYPGTGREFEEGKDEGLGFTKNTPVLPGQGEKEYKTLIQKDFIPAFDKFKPEVILVSAGFDAHMDDDMSEIRLTTAGFSWIMRQIMQLADKHANGRIVSVLEGGYSLSRLPELVRNHIEILLEAKKE